MLRITPFGKICAAQGVRLETFAALREFLLEEQQSGEIDELALIFTALSTPNGSTIRLVNPPTSEQCSDALMQKVEENAKRLFPQELIDEHGVERIVQQFHFTETGVTVHGAIKATHIMALWIEGLPLKKISQELRVGFAEGDVIKCGEVLGWLVRTTELIGQAISLDAEVTDQLGKLSQRLIFGVPEDALTLARFNSIARLRILNRDIQVRLVTAGFKSLNQIVEADAAELPLGYEYALEIQRAILKHIASIPKKEKRFHIQRLRAAQIDRDYGDIIRQCYDTYDHEFEDAVRGLLAVIGLRLRHISDRKPHRPDAITYVGETEDALIAWEFKAKKKNLVTQEEANEILSEGARYSPVAFVTVGKPDFDALPIENAAYMAKRENYKLIPLEFLCELAIDVWEGKRTEQQVHEILLNARGYLNSMEQVRKSLPEISVHPESNSSEPA